MCKKVSISLLLIVLFSVLTLTAVVAEPRPPTAPYQVQKLTASDSEERSRFGSAISIDGTTAVVGSKWDNDNGQNSGSAYILTKSSGKWSQVAKLVASDGASSDYFGTSVSISGDVIVIGAPEDDDGGNAAGTAYVFVKPGTGWAGTLNESAKLTASDAASNDHFGESVAISGDVIMVGAYYAQESVTDSGSVYVFDKPVGGWTGNLNEDDELTASDAVNGDRMGGSIALDGTTAVFGAKYKSGGGIAYVFTSSVGTWSETAKLTSSDAANNDFFGGSVAISGDTVVVGAPWNDDAGSSSGSAYVFVEPGTGWADATENAKLTASDAAASDEFGFSVAIDGNKVAVGAHYDADRGTNSGSAYFFEKPGGGWTGSLNQNYKRLASDGEAEDWFSEAVAVNGNEYWVGAMGDDDLADRSGAAYIYGPDNFAPEITSIKRYNPATEGTNASEVTFRVIFNEDVQNVGTADFALDTTDTASGTLNSVTKVTGYDAIYDVLVNGITGVGTLGLDVAAGNDVQDFTGNAMGDTPPIGTEETYTIVPQAPQNVQASDGTYTDKVAVSWDASTGASSYKVYRHTADDFAGATMIEGSAATNSHDDTSATPGTTYYYWVEACLTGVCSAESASDSGYAALIKKVFTSWKAYDGTIRESTEISNTGGWMDGTSTTCMVGDDWKDRQYRSILHFATGKLPDNAIVVQARLAVFKESFTGIRPFKTHGKLWGDIRAKGWSSNIALELNDFAAGASKNKIVSLKYVDGLVWRGLLNDEAFSFINLKGNTQFRLRFGIDDNDDMGKDTFNFYCGDYATVSKRPKLVVWYYVP